VLNLVVLGIVQGLTEFLPVSSTAHLLFVEHYLGIPRPGLVLEAVLHLGTTTAAVVMFWPDVVKLVAAFLGWLRHPSVPSQADPFARVALVIVVATVITGVIGLLFEKPLEAMFQSVRGTAWQLIVTGAILLAHRERGRRTAPEAGLGDGTLMGFGQALAIIPGISRSGTTIIAGLLRGFERSEAARLSFLIGIPAILAAALFSLKDAGEAGALGYSVGQLIVGGLTAGVVGGAAIAWLLNIVRRGRLAYFSIYCWVVAVFVLLTAR
jgi:undecaprenyl-diphosphatase